MKSFEEELDQRTAALEAARANKDANPEKWNKVAGDFAEWRRGIRLLGGRGLGDGPYTPDVVDFIEANPEDPRVVAYHTAKAAEHLALAEAHQGKV